MRIKSNKSEQGGPKVPGYIVTFSDMVTLLLTFFVMLLSLADVQDPELFDKGRDSFIDSLRYVGLGVLFGKRETPNFGNQSQKYSIPDSEDTSGNRTLDAKNEYLRRMFENLKQSVDAVQSQIVSESLDFSVTNVHFEAGRAELNDESIKFLRGYCRNLQQNLLSGQAMLYVLGLSTDENTEKEQLKLSARRAEAVAAFIRENVNSTDDQNQLPVYSWGAGAGGQWTDKDSPISNHSHILIAVLRTNT